MTAMTTSTAPKKTRSVTALSTGSRSRSAIASASTAVPVTRTTAPHCRCEADHSTGNARNAWAAADGSSVRMLRPQVRRTPETAIIA
jgi:hypothetical protein